ncbi:MAG: hypothetical protein CMO40_04555 [Verrucomicrobiaceae bacterium]|nr:hypothetical protein [Verrucomicrobiaceae bacterium]
MPSPSFKEYEVQPGDTLSAIGQLHGISSALLMEINGITNPDRIRIGEILRIPVAD